MKQATATIEAKGEGQMKVVWVKDGQQVESEYIQVSGEGNYQSIYKEAGQVLQGIYRVDAYQGDELLSSSGGIEYQLGIVEDFTWGLKDKGEDYYRVQFWIIWVDTISLIPDSCFWQFAEYLPWIKSSPYKDEIGYSYETSGTKQVTFKVFLKEVCDQGDRDTTLKGRERA